MLGRDDAAHPQLACEGRNISYALPVAPWEAALGATISVPTLGGKVELKIPAGSEAGRKLRLRGRGLPNGNSAAGDQIVELEVQAPAPEGDAQREAYGTLRDAFAGKWRRRSEERRGGKECVGKCRSRGSAYH